MMLRCLQNNKKIRNLKPQSKCSMVTKQHILLSIKFIALAVDEHAKVVLFGSRARGDFREDSDWDVLILLEKPVTETLKRQIRDLVFDLELETDTVISTLIENKADWANYAITPLFQNVEKEGVLA